MKLHNTIEDILGSKAKIGILRLKGSWGLIAGIDLEAEQKLGCPVSTVVVAEKEYAKKLKSKQGFWKAIPQESKLLFELEDPYTKC